MVPLQLLPIHNRARVANPMHKAVSATPIQTRAVSDREKKRRRSQCGHRLGAKTRQNAVITGRLCCNREAIDCLLTLTLTLRALIAHTSKNVVHAYSMKSAGRRSFI